MIHKEVLEKIDSKSPLEYYVIHERKAGPWDMVLLSNYPGEIASTKIDKKVERSDEVSKHRPL